MVRLSKLLRAPALLALLALPGVTPTPASSSDGSRPWGGTRIQPLDTAALAGVASAGTSGAAEPVTAALGRTPRADEILSNETTFTRWAFVGRIANIYERPSSSSRAVARLHWYTEDGFPEIYLVLRAHWDSRGREWIEVRIPMRPNGRTGWVHRDALDRLHLTHLRVVVDTARLQMRFYSRGRLLWTAPVGVGKASTPTPTGHFWVRERFKIADPSSGYWPYAFGTSDYSTLTDWPGGGVVGIHGPYYEPQSIPGRISHGCIRLRVSDDEWLAQHIELGTPVRVI